MERRELLKMVALATGGVVIGGELFLAGCKSKDAEVAGTAFSADNIAFLDEVAETIIPKTTTAGAKEAEVGKFMTVMVNDCYEEADQKTFHERVQWNLHRFCRSESFRFHRLHWCQQILFLKWYKPCIAKYWYWDQKL